MQSSSVAFCDAASHRPRLWVLGTMMTGGSAASGLWRRADGGLETGCDASGKRLLACAHVG